MCMGKKNDSIEMKNADLTGLLKRTQRRCHIMGKAQNQVTACILRAGFGDRVTTTSLVRDGKTSLSRFSAGGTGTGAIIVPDIDRLVGVLKAHGESVNLTALDGRIRVVSGRKQTTLTANLEGLAFPHSRETIGEWEEKSRSRAKQIGDGWYHIINKDEKRKPFCSWTLDADAVYDAFACDGINGQTLNRYRFNADSSGISVITGTDLKGLTTSHLSLKGEKDAKEWSATFEGGLENVLRGIKGDVRLDFFDFRDLEQGIRLVLQLPGGGFVLQAGVLE